MPWTCPACQQQVEHNEDAPRGDRVYRCSVCRLQMTFDFRTQKMRPLPSDDDDHKPHEAA